jgi:electron transfer flavoprotein beta subunit
MTPTQVCATDAVETMGASRLCAGDLRVLVSCKVTPDFEALPAASWAAEQGGPGERGAPETRYVRRVLNCFDESALELALRLRDTLVGRGEAAALGALSVGGRDTEPFFRTLLALGYERAIRVTAGDGGDGDAASASCAAESTAEPPEAAGSASVGPVDLDFAPALTAGLIAAAVRRAGGCDVLLMGCRAGPGDSGTVPFFVAEELGWPCLAPVVDLDLLADGRLRVASAVDDGLLRATVRPPCVLAIGNAVVSHLRVPTLQSRLAVGARRIEVFTAAELGVDVTGEAASTAGTLVGFEALPRTRTGTVVAGETAGEKARALYEEHLRPRIAALRSGGRTS